MASGSDDTRRLLVHTAVELIAARGVDGVSLREIGLAAGQGNNAVVHYYFGSREGLLRGVLEQIAVEHEAVFTEIARQQLPTGRQASPHELAAALVLPPAALLDAEFPYLQFITRVMTDPERALALTTTRQAEHFRAVRHRTATDLGSDAGERRFDFAVTLTFHALADRVQFERTSPQPETRSSFVDDLVDAVAAVLAGGRGVSDTSRGVSRDCRALVPPTESWPAPKWTAHCLPGTKPAPSLQDLHDRRLPDLLLSPTVPPVRRQNLHPIRGDGRRAGQIARQIEAEIVASEWQVGEVLGSEVVLQQRYGVGRSVLREAVRLLEARGVARRRPGPGGGLVVTAPERDPVLHAASLFLDHRKVRPEHLYAAWSALECAAVESLARTIDDHGVTHLRLTLQQEKERGLLNQVMNHANIHVEIARLSANPAFELFLGVVLELALTHGRHEVAEVDQQWLHERHSEIVDAIVAGDAALAAGRVRRFVDRLAAVGAIEGPTPAKRSKATK